MTAFYGVVGNPIFHSKSPLIFNTALRELSLDAVYVRCAAGSAAEAMDLARETGMSGLNVTSPFKTAIVAYLDRLEGAAATIGSVNTVKREGDEFVGYNTDGDGVLAAVRTAFPDLADVNALVLGAEGAAKAAALALGLSGARVVIVNRTYEKARQAAAQLGCTSMPLDAIDEALKSANLLVSAISADEKVVARDLLRKDLVVLDAHYGRQTPLVKDAEEAGCTVIDGREWLLGQAVSAFRSFTGQAAPTEIMRKVLHKRRIDSRRNIGLIGFMGTGKTAVAAELGLLTDMAVVDIDKRIEERAKLSISDIFANQGEAEFRRLEQEEIEEARLDTDQVISYGGGAVLSRTNVRVLRNNCISVWLWADVPTALTRIGKTGSRPLLSGSEPEKTASDLLFSRMPFYARTCDLLVGTRGRSPKEIAERIWHEVHHAFEG
jgi:shikimate dehydrogenase